MDRATVVIDIGKTSSKISLWNSAGQFIARETRQNQLIYADGRRVLDAAGIEDWLAGALKNAASKIEIGAIIPVGHGAAATIICEGKLLYPPADYEAPIPPTIRAAYDRKRDPFSLTGSPSLPNGLNLGAQLFASPQPMAEGSQVLPWPQYWAWKLSGNAASEVTSLGCHTDLWHPQASHFSGLADSMDWTSRFPPLRLAGDVLDCITPEWSAKTGLPTTTRIHCGIHDSNAALLAARAFPEMRGIEATVLSTGTWFVAMRSPANGAELPELTEGRDCLLNVDAYGKPIPSARFMGGREVELLMVDPQDDSSATTQGIFDALPRVVRTGSMVLPTFVPGVGPFPRHRGGWLHPPENKLDRWAATYLYLAMVASASLNLIGATGRILVEGRFARAEVFVRALATLRPRDTIYTTESEIDVSFGALCLLNKSLQPASPLRRAEPLEVDLTNYHAVWTHETNGAART